MPKCPIESGNVTKL